MHPIESEGIVPYYQDMEFMKKPIGLREDPGHLIGSPIGGTGVGEGPGWWIPIRMQMSPITWQLNSLQQDPSPLDGNKINLAINVLLAIEAPLEIVSLHFGKWKFRLFCVCVCFKKGHTQKVSKMKPSLDRLSWAEWHQSTACQCPWCSIRHHTAAPAGSRETQTPQVLEAVEVDSETSDKDPKWSYEILWVSVRGCVFPCLDVGDWSSSAVALEFNQSQAFSLGKPLGRITVVPEINWLNHLVCFSCCLSSCLWAFSNIFLSIFNHSLSWIHRLVHSKLPQITQLATLTAMSGPRSHKYPKASLVPVFVERGQSSHFHLMDVRGIGVKINERYNDFGGRITRWRVFIRSFRGFSQTSL